MKTIAILQSNYIPWKGYFDLIDRADEFILYDEMQYTKNDWRNRNQIKTAAGLSWLSIPVDTKGKPLQRIDEARVVDHHWCRKHLNALRMNYSRAAYFKDFFPRIEDLYMQCAEEDLLTRINECFLRGICEILGITTKISRSSDYHLIEGKTERLVRLVQDAGGTEYLSGPAAKCYIQEELFKEADLTLTWMDYSGYRPYPQLFGDFVHNVSILDLLFNTGPEALSYLRIRE